MKKTPAYKGGGPLKGDPNKPVKTTIDFSKYKQQLSKPIEGVGTNVVGDSQDTFSPDVLKGMGYNYVSGTMGGKDIVYEKNGNYHVYNEQPNAKQNKFGLINIGNPNALANTTTTPNLSLTPQTKPIQTPDVNHKPLNLSNPNLTYNPNTGQYFNPVTQKAVEPIVQQFNNGGKVKKMSKYYNGYTLGGSTTYNEQYNVPNQINNNDTPAAADPNVDKSGRGAKAAGAVSSTGTILGFATKAKDAVQSGFKKDNYGYIGNDNQRALNDVITPTYQQVGNKLKQGDYSGALKEQFLGAQYVRAAQNLLGNGEKDTKFNRFFGVGDDYRKAQEQRTNDAADQAAQQASQLGIESQGRIQNAAALRDAGDNTDVVDNFYQKPDDNGAVKLAGIANTGVGSGVNLGNALTKGSVGRKAKSFGKLLGFSEGGKIEGKGTGKSDSITAKVKGGSFIVPKENAKVAEMLRKTLLNKPNKKADLNQAGGSEIKVSNGEHSFSPEEVEELTKNGIDLNELAPHAKSALHFNDGGLTPEKARQILEEGVANKHVLSSQQKKFFGWVAGGRK